MAQTIILETGQTRQLRVQGEVERWLSDAPLVAVVSDEDLLSGRHGGLITSLSPGQARIRAIGFGGECLAEVEVTVSGNQPILLAAGASAQIEAGSGTWTSTNPMVAQVDGDGLVRGVSPGIAIVRPEGGESRREHQVRVTGAVEIGVGVTAAMSERFSVPVHAWHTASSSARVDNQGMVTAGDRPLTVAITVTLRDGEDFSFDLRIVRTAAGEVPELIAYEGRLSPSVPPSYPPGFPGTRSPIAPDEEVAADQRAQVEEHLSRAAGYMAQQQWEQAGAELRAAEVAASGDPDVVERVRATADLVRATALGAAEAACSTAVAAMRRGEHDHARAALTAARFPAQARNLPEFLTPLADRLALIERVGCSSESIADLQRCLEGAWDASVDARMAGVLHELAAVSVDWELESMADRIAGVFGRAPLLDCSETVRTGLAKSLKALGAPGISAVVHRLALTDSNDPTGGWLLDLLVSLSPGQHAGVLVRAYDQQSQAERQRFASWLSDLLTRSPGAFFDLMGGVIRRIPLDKRIGIAVRKELRRRDPHGPDKLENEAIAWASRGHKCAKTVLERICGYAD